MKFKKGDRITSKCGEGINRLYETGVVKEVISDKSYVIHYDVYGGDYGKESSSIIDYGYKLSTKEHRNKVIENILK